MSVVADVYEIYFKSVAQQFYSDINNIAMRLLFLIDMLTDVVNSKLF